MVTSMLEANLARHMVGLAHKPLLQFFLVVQKAYDLLDRERFLKLLRRYRMGTNLSQILDNYWKRQRIVPKVGKCLGTAFGTGIGFT